MSYTIKISNETADSLFKDILVQDFQRLKEDIAKAEANLESLEPFEFEDLVDWRRWYQALAVTLEYYLTEDEQRALLDADSQQNQTNS